jgi:hypothetical protein
MWSTADAPDASLHQGAVELERRRQRVRVPLTVKLGALAPPARSTRARGAVSALSRRGIHVSAICPGIINTVNTAIVSTGIMRGDLAEMQGQAASFYANTSPDEVTRAVLKAIGERRLIAPVPRRQVTLPHVPPPAPHLAAACQATGTQDGSRQARAEPPNRGGGRA